MKNKYFKIVNSKKKILFVTKANNMFEALIEFGAEALKYDFLKILLNKYQGKQEMEIKVCEIEESEYFENYVKVSKEEKEFLRQII